MKSAFEFWVSPQPAELEAALPGSMPKRSIVRVPHPLGCRVDCVSGCIWITHDGTPSETILEAGESYVSDVPARMVVFALEAARVRWG